MQTLTTFQYNLIGDVFTRPMFYASSASSRLIECLSYVGKILTDDESQLKIENLCKGLTAADGEVKKVMFVEENQKETLAQVFTDCRYTKRDNEALSATLLEALRRQGFLD